MGVLTIDPEGQIEGSARGHDPKIAIEHDQGLGDRIHDGLRQNAHVPNAQEGLNIGHDVGSFYLTPPGKKDPRRACERKLSHTAHFCRQLHDSGGRDSLPRGDCRAEAADLLFLISAKWNLIGSVRFSSVTPTE